MATILESLTESLRPDILGQVGLASGLDRESTSRGLAVVGPLLTGALANVVATPNGLDGLMGMVSQLEGSSSTGDLLRIATNGTGSQMTSGILGSGLPAVVGTLDRALGFKVGWLIAIALPLVINQIHQRVKSGSLDKAGVARLLQDEQKALDSRNDVISQLVQKALAAGRDATTTRARYSIDQWNTLRLGPMAAASLVISASPSNAMGIAKEVTALAEAVTTLKQSSAPSSIFSLIAAEDVTGEELKALPTDQDAMLGLVKNSVAAVAANSPSHAASYGQCLVDLATRVAEAAKEGGLLGFGGSRVSDEELAVIDQIRTAVAPAPRASAR